VDKDLSKSINFNQRVRDAKWEVGHNLATCGICLLQTLWIESRTEVENNLASHSIQLLQTTTKALVRMVASTASCEPSLPTKPLNDSGKARILTLRKESERQPGVPSLSSVRSCDLEECPESKANSLGNVLDDF
jgi:hypothetical protein